MSKTTELRIKPTSFDEAMEAFCTKLEENVKPYVDRFNHMDSVTFRQDGGMKYIKVKSFQVNIDTTPSSKFLPPIKTLTLSINYPPY